MKVFLSVAAVLIALLGAAWLLAPEPMLGSWGVQTDPVPLVTSSAGVLVDNVSIR